MQFNTLYFILFFCPIVWALYTWIGRSSKKKADLMLLLASLFFYGTQSLSCLAILVLSILVNYLFIRLMEKNRLPKKKDKEVSLKKTQQEEQKAEPSGKKRKALLAADIVFNAGLLGYFKYTNFVLLNLNAVMGTDFPMADIILPVGISFYTFSEIAFAVDVYRGSGITEGISFTDYALYAAWFPKLLQGPIALPKYIVPQIRSKERAKVSSKERAEAVQMFVFGLAKKVLIADTLGEAVSWGFKYLVLTSTGDMLVTMLSYTFQIYFDFSGYSDMALGVSMLFGYRLRPNFDSPYKADSITDFWRRWHISLTDFLREYIYFPLGGSRKGKAKTYRNILTVFLVSGIWHGANWTFILWGVLHGLGQAAERAGAKVYQKVPRAIRWCITFFLVSLFWMIFRSADIEEFRRVLWHLFVDRHFTFNPELMEIFRIPGVRNVLSVLHLEVSDSLVSGISMAIWFVFLFVLCLFTKNTQRRTYHYNRRTLVLMAALFFVCLMSMSGISTFVYNNF